jgi:hypothetical protein
MTNLGVVSREEFKRMLIERKAFVPEAFPSGYFEEEARGDSISSGLELVKNCGLEVDRALDRFQFGKGEVSWTEAGNYLVGYEFVYQGETCFVSVAKNLSKGGGYVAVAGGVNEIFYFSDLSEVVSWLGGFFDA